MTIKSSFITSTIAITKYLICIYILNCSNNKFIKTYIIIYFNLNIIGILKLQLIIIIVSSLLYLLCSMLKSNLDFFNIMTNCSFLYQI